MKQVFNFLWHSIRKYRVYYFIMICAPILGAIYKPLVFYAIKIIVDVISNTHDFTFNQIIYPLLLYIAADILISATWRISNVAAWKSEPYVQQGIFLRALQTVLSFNYSFFQNTPSGSLVSKIKGLFDGYNELWSQLWYGVSYWILASITTGVSIFLVSDLLGIIIMIWASLFIFTNYFFTKRINLLSQLQNEAKHLVIGQISDCLSNAQSVKLFSTRMYEYNRLKDEISNDFIPKEIRSYKYRLKIDIFNDLMGISIIVTMLLIMMHLKRLNLVTTGDFVFAFGMVFQLQENLWHLMTEFHKLSDRMGDLKSSLSIYNFNKIEYTSHDSTNDDYDKLYPNPPSIIFNNISFSYTPNKIIFKNLDLTIKSGEHIGIVGYTGAGKTTLINLLLKIFVAQQGNILINNKNISEIDCDLLRSYIAIIPQDISLFHRTLMENIRYGKLDASDNDVVNASIKAHADEFISRLPDGYNTLVGERGVKLSGGQRQRIAIARAILKDAPILILDEATSSLDSITELYIQSSIKELLKGRTVLAIAHRLSTLKNMDRLVVIDKGNIIESGTHDMLLSQSNSLYSKIWQTQYSQIDMQ